MTEQARTALKVAKARTALHTQLDKLDHETASDLKWAIDDLIEAHLEAFADRIEEATGIRP